MANQIFPSEVYLEEQSHRYFHKTKKIEFESVSSVYKHYLNAFDTHTQKYRSAIKQIKQAGLTPDQNIVDRHAKRLEKKWKENSIEKSGKGTDIHKSLELYGKTREVANPEHLELCESVFYYLYKQYDYDIILDEVIVYSEDFRVAGTMDKPAIRSLRSKNKVLDIYDYKSNEKIDTFSAYGNRMKAPFEYLEDCSYIYYSIQMSIYMYLSELSGFTPGKITLLHLSQDLKTFNPIACAYLRPVAKFMVENAMFEKKKREIAQRIKDEHTV